MPRWLVTFSRDELLQYVGHLDLSRSWQRALRRAGLTLACTQGFHPHPKLAFAAPLAVGVIGASELMDVTIVDDLSPEDLMARISKQLPEGLRISGIAPLEGPPLAARLRLAEYRAEMDCDLSDNEITARLDSLLLAGTLPRVRQINRSQRHYDLRPLIAGLSIERWDSVRSILMSLRAGNDGAGRPDEVIAALGLEAAPARVTRTRLVLAEQAV